MIRRTLSRLPMGTEVQEFLLVLKVSSILWQIKKFLEFRHFQHTRHNDYFYFLTIVKNNQKILFNQ